VLKKIIESDLNENPRPRTGRATGAGQEDYKAPAHQVGSAVYLGGVDGQHTKTRAVDAHKIHRLTNNSGPALPRCEIRRA
jgi:hypothetical protein